MWRIWVDTGGTFTDCLATGPGGVVRRVKVLSSGAVRGVVAESQGRRLLVRERWGAPAGFTEGSPLTLANGGPRATVSRHEVAPHGSVLELDAELPARAGEIIEIDPGLESPLLAAHLATGTRPGDRLPPIEMRLATTRATNALLERRGGRVALFVTRGFGDLLRIGTQQRPDLFALNIVRPPPLYERVVEAPGRIGARGEVVEDLDPTAIAGAVDGSLAAGATLAAVALLHSWINPEHERRLGAFLRERGFEHVSLSAELSPTIKVLPRAQTAVVNAYLAPVVEHYLEKVALGITGGVPARPGLAGPPPVLVMTSAGGLVRAERFAPKDSLLSGPAAGVVGAAAAARRSGFSRILTLDMGGTSTDVARSDGGWEYVFEHAVGDARIAAPALAVESVAAGGGSVCWIGPGGLEVGPRSAGSAPGPACYGAGGPLTVTDVNLLLGRLDAGRFGVPVVRQAAVARAEELRVELEALTGERLGLEAMLGALVEVADERMAEAVRRISVRRGFDPAGHVLVAFGGAGGQHACGVAERLGVLTVLIPPDVGLLSAVGLGGAAVERFAEKQVLRPLNEIAPHWAGLIAELAARAVSMVAHEGAAPERIAVRRRLVSLRLAGQESSLVVEADDNETVKGLQQKFAALYRIVYGYDPGPGIEVESVRVVAAERAHETSADAPPAPRGGTARTAPVWSRDGWAAAGMVERAGLPPGRETRGPALIIEDHGTTLVASGWTARVDEPGAIVLTRDAPGRPPAPARARPEIVTGRLRAIAAEMGETLRRTAVSTNVKERLDFSCAVLDEGGDLIVNAPHIPVHLGALGVCVRMVRDALELGPGDVAVTNHPGFGGSHLPDVTVVMPVAAAGRRIGYVANRAHHAEIGGARPGSMPPGARTLAEEGVVIPPTYAVRRGVARLDDLRRALESGPWPTRAPGDNMADLSAQIAAARNGAAALAALAGEVGAEALAGTMRGMKDRAEQKTREALLRMRVPPSGGAGSGPDAPGPMPRRGRGSFAAEERLDDGSVIRVAISVRNGRAVIDFAGSAGVHPGNFNAPPGVVRSAVMYVLRLLIDEDLPLNEGVMRAVRLRIPPGMLNPPFASDPAHCPAVAAGNVETSQRVVDTLIKALGLAACGQGTMNNVIFGDERFGYYETVGGGAGAGPGFDGASGVHTHMTNTAITDPEILERRYPVRLRTFALRVGSGGSGKWRGGDGIAREFEFLEPVWLSLIAQHRIQAPFGMAGGEPGATGAQRVLRRDGSTLALAGSDGCHMTAGDRLILETPGGGGYGRVAPA